MKQVLLAAVLLPLLSQGLNAQDRGIPGASYYAAIDLLYRGEYQRAQRSFTSELRGAIKTVDTRWVDSICFHAMLGEAYYLQGRNAEALVEFDNACNLFLSHHRFLQRVQYPQLRPEGNRARRQAPWGRTSRRVTHAALSPTLLIQYGSINNQQQYEAGGLVQSAQYWRLNVAEVVRTLGLAIRRRTELLGPLAPHDPLSRSLDERLSRGGIAPPGSWVNSWIDLLTGLAKLSVNKPKEALPYLSRGTLLEGQLDHPLTGVALLAQAEALMAAGSRAAAAQLLVEASLAAFAYQDFDAVDQALWRGHVNHQVIGVKGPYPLLDGAIAWADRENFDPLSIRYRQAKAESLLAVQQSQPALALLRSRSRRRGLASSPLAARTQFLIVQALYSENQIAEASEALQRALTMQSVFSLHGFQTATTNASFDSNALSPRLAVQVYERLLADPQPVDWLNNPHDVLSHLKTPHEPAGARWFAALLGRREFDKAIAAADLVKRRRFFASLPMGGRLVALRQLLNDRPGAEPLAEAVEAQRQAWLLSHPEYVATTQAAAPLIRKVDLAKTLLAEDRLAKEIDNAFDMLHNIGLERERRLRAMALERRAAPLSFPPAMTVEEAQKRLRPGDAVLVFHQAADSMSGFLLVAGGHHYWRLPNTPKLEGKVAALLRSVGVTGRQATLTTEAAADDAWRTAAQDLGEVLFKDSRLDLSKTERLMIVPDGVLWHLPFEVLIPPGSDDQPLIDITRLRYAPTLALAVPSDQPMRPVRKAAVVTAKAPANDREGIHQQAVDHLAEAIAVDGQPAEQLQPPVGAPAAQLAAAYDLLLVTLESQIDPASPYSWRPAPLGRSGASLANWMRLEGAAPERVVLGGSHTAVENSLKAGRRARRGASPLPVGWEMFHAACGLMAGGTRTGLITRWTTDGLTQQNLLREFAAEAPHVAAPDAWRRSVALARSAHLDPAQEPRLQADIDDDPPLADHPFFWAGYLLLDTSFDPADALPAEPVDEE